MLSEFSFDAVPAENRGQRRKRVVTVLPNKFKNWLSCNSKSHRSTEQPGIPLFFPLVLSWGAETSAKRVNYVRENVRWHCHSQFAIVLRCACRHQRTSKHKWDNNTTISLYQGIVYITAGTGIRNKKTQQISTKKNLVHTFSPTKGVVFTYVTFCGRTTVPMARVLPESMSPDIFLDDELKDPRFHGETNKAEGWSAREFEIQTDNPHSLSSKLVVETNTQN